MLIVALSKFPQTGNKSNAHKDGIYKSTVLYYYNGKYIAMRMNKLHLCGITWIISHP